jgi:hypothetical protein
MEFLNEEIFYVPINIIKYYNINEKYIKDIKENEIFRAIGLLKQKNINVSSFDFESFVRDFLPNKFDNSKDIETYINKYKQCYFSISNNGLFENRKDPISLIRIRKGYKNMLVIDSGTVRFFVAMFLGIEKIPTIIIDETTNDNYYEFI